MATKKECDRCKKQWDPTETTGGWGESAGDKELCTVSISLPQDTTKHSRPAVNKQAELCQDCGRRILAELTELPKEAGR
jgi:hypothetical protein